MLLHPIGAAKRVEERLRGFDRLRRALCIIPETVTPQDVIIHGLTPSLVDPLLYSIPKWKSSAKMMCGADRAPQPIVSQKKTIKSPIAIPLSLLYNRGMMNEIVRYLNLDGFEEDIAEGKGLKIVVHGPKREYMQVFVCDKKDFKGRTERPSSPRSEVERI